ncbi:hypothetical protein ACQP00_09070 [Dactylosporangium sp. CS-047395]|uniref:hypothetical protein n=1 Tax=Dactylosporangium sp. CS-047395 TaxID=3239936 RepID=UPI003D8AA389
MRRWSVAAGAAAVLGVGMIGVAATPAWAADPLQIKVSDGSVQGKVGDKVQVRFTIKNNTKQPIANVTVVVTAPANAVLEQGDNPGCAIGSAGRAASCKGGTLAAEKSGSGAITLTVKTAGQAGGRIAVEHGNADNFALRATGGPTPSATKTTAKPTKTSTLNASDSPTLTGDETFAPPEAGNGVAIQPTSDQAVRNTSGTGGGLGFGLWVGIIAIVGALGLIGSLFYFRRKDRNEPDTGMHPVVPGPSGYPGGPGAYAPPPQPTTYGSPQPTTYGNPAAATQMINPNFGAQPGAQPGPTQVIRPGAAEQTVVFRRPDDL